MEIILSDLSVDGVICITELGAVIGADGATVPVSGLGDAIVVVGVAEYDGA